MPHIFIHGLGEDASSWNKTLSHISTPTDALVPSLPNILNNKEPTYTNLYKAFSNYCNNIPGALHLCGFSLGGILAINYVIDYPKKVQSLILIGARYNMPKALLKFQNFLFRLMPQKYFQPPGYTKKGTIELTNSMLDLDFSNQIKSISCATSVICGEKDTANKKSAIFLAQTIPSAEFHLIENAAHQVTAEAPEKLAILIEAFYQNQTN